MTRGGDVVILGGGVIGLTTAYYLAREGVRVRLLDRGQLGQEASWAGAGILPPSHWATAREPFDRLRALSGRLFPELSAELRERSGIDNEYIRCGGLEFIKPPGDKSPLEWSGEGIPYQMLTEQAAAELEPALRLGLGRVVLLPTLGQLRNPRHLQALRTACERSGQVTFAEGAEAQQFVLHGRKVRAVVTSHGTVDGDAFVLAAGAWTDPLLEPLGVRVGIRPVRGQIVLFNPGYVLFRRVLLWGSSYLVPRQDGRVLAGSTEEDAGFVKQNTARGVSHLIGLAVGLVPALEQVEVERCWAGLRPGSPDGLPFIGRVAGLDNLVVAAGHFRAGIQLSPGTALLVKELLLGQPLSMSLEAFRPERTSRDD
jgi:glycine oxidase